MSNIKLYTASDFIPAYLNSWGYVEMDKIITIQSAFEKESKQAQLDDLFDFFNKKLDHILNAVMPNSKLEAEQKRAYFKLIFLHQKVYKNFFLFGDLTEKNFCFLKKILQNSPYPIVPDDLPAPMITQKIVIYRPFTHIKKQLKKIFKK